MTIRSAHRTSLATAAMLLGLSTALLAAAPASLSAQGKRIGVIAGPNYASLRGLNDVELDNRSGSMGGLSFVLPLASFVAFQPEALVVTGGAEPRSGTDDGITLTYAQVPMLLRITPATGSAFTPHFYAGPYLGLQIRCRVEIDSQTSDCDDAPGISTETVDVGGIVGGGLDVGLGPLVLTGGVRYGFGVSKVAEFELDNVREEAKNGIFAVYAGLAIQF